MSSIFLCLHLYLKVGDDVRVVVTVVTSIPMCSHESIQHRLTRGIL